MHAPRGPKTQLTVADVLRSADLLNAAMMNSDYTRGVSTSGRKDEVRGANFWALWTRDDGRRSSAAAAAAFWHSATSGVTLYTFQTTAAAAPAAQRSPPPRAATYDDDGDGNDEAIHLG